MIYDEPEERLSLFRKAFGEDLRAFDTEFLRYVIRLNN